MPTGQEHPSTFRAMDNLAQSIAGQGKLQEALTLKARTLELRNRILGTDDSTTLLTRFQMAGLIGSQGRFDEARRLLDQVLESQRRVIGPKHPDTLSSAHQLANTLLDLGKLEEARALHESTLEIRRRVLGPEHPQTLRSADSLSTMFWRQGELERGPRPVRAGNAPRCCRRILRTRITTSIGTSICHLAIVLRDQGKFSEARALFEQVPEASPSASWIPKDTLVRRRVDRPGRGASGLSRHLEQRPGAGRRSIWPVRVPN